MNSSFQDSSPPSNTQIREYFNILRDDPGSRVFAPLAEALIRRGRLDEAEKICRMGLEANPDFSDGHLAFARVQFYMFRHTEAIEAIKLTLGLDPNNLDAYLIAAEIFLARSQLNAASQACMKVIDLDPDNQKARSLLKRTGVSPARNPPVEAVKMNTDSFRASAGTAPSRRLMSPEEQAPLAEPFRELLQATGETGATKLDESPQPFSALSPGSQGDNRGGDDTSDAPAQLPPHPPLHGDDLLSQVPDGPQAPPSPAGPAPAPEPPDPTLDERPAPRQRQRIPPSQPPPPTGSRRQPSAGIPVEAVQKVIDQYTDRMPTDDHPHPPLKVPRSGRLLAVLTVLVAVAGIAALVTLGLESSRIPAQAPDGGDTGPAGPASGRGNTPDPADRNPPPGDDHLPTQAAGTSLPAGTDGRTTTGDAADAGVPGDDSFADGADDGSADASVAREPDGRARPPPRTKVRPRRRRRRRRPKKRRRRRRGVRRKRRRTRR